MGKTQGEKKIGLCFIFRMSYVILKTPNTSKSKAESQAEIENPIKIDSSPTKKLATNVAIMAQITTTMFMITQMRGRY